MLTSPPKILLVGAGRFGRHHLEEWLHLAEEGRVDLAGVVVSTENSRTLLKEKINVPVYLTLEDRLLAGVDGVDIATPSETHADLVGRALKHTNVLVEKPLALEVAEAEALHALATSLGRILMVGHVYRFHPVINRVRELIKDMPQRPQAVEALLVNPIEPGIERYDTNLEILHPFDMIDYLFGVTPEFCIGQRRATTHRISIRYPGSLNVIVTIGWASNQSRRTLTLTYNDRTLHCDMIDNSIEIKRRDAQVEKLFFPHRHQALAAEFRSFLEVIQGKSCDYPTAQVGARIIDVALRCRPAHRPTRPRVAVLGGGVFGATCAMELDGICDVELYERHADFMTEASYVNQWRHHSGFHYPRSYDTIQEIKVARDAFEAKYRQALLQQIPAYYAVSAEAVEVPALRYRAACTGMGLSFTEEYPPADVLDPTTVSLSFKTDEAVYDFEKLRSMVVASLKACETVRINLRSNVVKGVFDANGRKRLTIRACEGVREESFDYIINATYANLNQMPQWFGFPTEPMRFDLIELLLLNVPAPQVCVTIIDGPFTSLVGTGIGQQFILSHRFDMVLGSIITPDGVPPPWGTPGSNRENMLRHASKYLPVLKKAAVLESRYVTRTVNAYAKDFDARPTIIRDHGFGCWSVLGGKIITCVSNAREIAETIKLELRPT